MAVFAQDYAIRRFGERGHNIVHWPEFDRGGHFATKEVPDLLVGDVRAFFRASFHCFSHWAAAQPNLGARLGCPIILIGLTGS